MKKNISLALALFSCLYVSACVTVPQEKQINKNQLAISSVRDIPISYPLGSLFSLAPKYVKETSLKPAQTQTVYKLYANAIIADLKTHGYKNTEDASSSVFHVGFGIALASDLSDEVINDKFGITPGLLEIILYRNVRMHKIGFLFSYLLHGPIWFNATKSIVTYIPIAWFCRK